jgi:hypothetical protein
MEHVRLPRLDLLTDINAHADMPIQFARGCPVKCKFCDIIEIYHRLLGSWSWVSLGTADPGAIGRDAGRPDPPQGARSENERVCGACPIRSRGPTAAIRASSARAIGVSWTPRAGEDIDGYPTATSPS